MKKIFKNLLGKALVNFRFFAVYPNWISVDKQMPELHDIVIIKRKKFISAGTFHGDYWWDRGYDSKCEQPNEVVAWMPLPPKT